MNGHDESTPVDLIGPHTGIPKYFDLETLLAQLVAYGFDALITVHAGEIDRGLSKVVQLYPVKVAAFHHEIQDAMIICVAHKIVQSLLDQSHFAFLPIRHPDFLSYRHTAILGLRLQ